ncbi:unnamed protein product, partial [Scytosiphon promiscuus]
ERRAPRRGKAARRGRNNNFGAKQVGRGYWQTAPTCPCLWGTCCFLLSRPISLGVPLLFSGRAAWNNVSLFTIAIFFYRRLATRRGVNIIVSTGTTGHLRLCA